MEDAEQRLRRRYSVARWMLAQDEHAVDLQILPKCKVVRSVVNQRRDAGWNIRNRVSLAALQRQCWAVTSPAVELDRSIVASHGINGWFK